MKAPRVTVSEWHRGEWWHSAASERQANVSTRDYSDVCLMLTTQPWSTEAQEPGVRTDRTKMLYRVHLR